MITRAEARRILPELRERIHRHQHEYYVTGRTSVSDSEYDLEFDELLRIEGEHPDLVTPDSPSLRVGSDLSVDFPEVQHTVPVLSLDKVYTIDELEAWTSRIKKNAGREISFVIEEKLDGISMVLYYEKGVLSRAVTRGNGFVGNDVTANVRTIRSVPLRLGRPLDIAVRGEIVLPLSEFGRLNQSMETPYANPRNLAAGTIRRNKSSDVAAVPLTMYAYEAYYAGQPVTHHEVLAELVALGFYVNEHLGFFGPAFADEPSAPVPGAAAGSLRDLDEFVSRSTRERRSRPYELDGLVAKVDEIPLREELGFTGHHPRWAIAFKFESPESQSRVRAIDVQVGRTGRITPVARIEPVQVGGTTVSNVTLHNQDYVNSLEIAVGDLVAVSRRGDVIPAIERVLEKNEAASPVWGMPDRCPSCGTLLERQGAHHFCTNYGCPARRRGLLTFFCGRGQMDIENLGPETLDFLIDHAFVTEPSDIYSFDYDRLLEFPGFGEKKVTLIRQGVEKSKSQPFRVVLPSLGIAELGPKATELILEDGIRDIDALFGISDAGDVQRLISIHGIGEKTAATIVASLSDPRLREEVARLRAAGLQFSEAETASSDTEGLEQIFDGQVWCVTGSFQAFQPRSLAMDEVKKRGGRIVSDVTGKTTHLLAGTGAGGKLARAQDSGASIVTEEEFLKLIGLG